MAELASAQIAGSANQKFVKSMPPCVKIVKQSASCNIYDIKFKRKSKSRSSREGHNNASTWHGMAAAITQGILYHYDNTLAFHYTGMLACECVC